MQQILELYAGVFKYLLVKNCYLHTGKECIALDLFLSKVLFIVFSNLAKIKLDIKLI